MKSKCRAFLTALLVGFFGSSLLLAQGDIALDADPVCVGSEVTATLLNDCIEDLEIALESVYEPPDDDIQEELDEGHLRFEPTDYNWSFYPDGDVLSADPELICTGEFNTPSAAEDDKTIQVTVDYNVIYDPDDDNGDVVDTDSHDFSVNLTVVEVGLEPISVDNRPLIEPGRICLNAQSEYEIARWEATVRPDGTEAWVYYCDSHLVVGPGETTSGTFDIMPNTRETGEYEITLKHKLLDSCTAKGNETVFKLKMIQTEPTYSPASTGDFANVDQDNISFITPTEDPIEQKQAADVETKKFARFETDPEGKYNGYVRTQLTASQDFNSTYPDYGVGVQRAPLVNGNLSISLNFGIVSVTAHQTEDEGAWSAWRGQVKIKGPNDNDARVNSPAQANAKTSNIGYIQGGWDEIKVDTPAEVTTHPNHYQVGNSNSRAVAETKHSCSGARDSEDFYSKSAANLGDLVDFQPDLEYDELELVEDSSP